MVTRRITRAGTTAATWSGRLAEARLPALEPLPGAGDHVLVVAAHPDDEGLGVGGLMRRLAERDVALHLLWATDGEASHPDAPASFRARLRGTRRREAVAGLAALGVTPASTTFLGRPDSGLHDLEDELAGALAPHLRDRALALTTWSGDGHPDHEACGRAVAAAAGPVGVPVVEYPVWLWDWGHPEDPDLPWATARTIRLDEADRAAKRTAAAAHASQVVPAPGDDEAVLPPHVLAHFDPDFQRENFVRIIQENAWPE